MFYSGLYQRKKDWMRVWVSVVVSPITTPAFNWHSEFSTLQ